MSDSPLSDGAKILAVTRDNYEENLKTRAAQDLLLNSSPQVQKGYQTRANNAQTKQAARAGAETENDRWESATTVVVIYACGSPRSYSAKNSDKGELQGVKNAFQNAVNQNMQVALFTYEAQYPTFWEQVLSKTPFSYKWWSDNVKDLKMVKCNRLNPNDITAFQREKSSQSLGLALVEFLLERLGISSTPKFKTDLVLHIFRSEPKKLTCTAVKFEELLKTVKKIKGLADKVVATDKLIHEDVMSIERVGADYVDKIFLMEPNEAKKYYFDDFEIVNDKFNVYGFKDAAVRMRETVINSTYVDRLELRETHNLLLRVGTQSIKISLQLINIGFKVKDF